VFVNTKNRSTSNVLSSQQPQANKASSSLLIGATALVVTLAANISLGLLAYAHWWEPRRVQLERLTLPIANTQGRLPEAGLRILHLSDTHFQGKRGAETAKSKRILELTRGLEYDLLIHTGDFIHYDSGLDSVLNLLDALPAPRLGRFAVLGNHDYAWYNMQSAAPRMWKSWRKRERQRGVPRWILPLRLPGFIKYVRNTPLDGRRGGYNDSVALTQRLEEHGYTVLHNRALHIQPPSEATGEAIDFWLAGIDDVTEGRPRLGETLVEIPPSEPLLLLSHNPDILASAQIGRVDVVLSGHTHGGQIVVPLWGPAHTQSWHLQRSEVSGYMRRGRTQIYITRGIGEGIPLRFNAPPQIALITLVPETAQA
jgi:predicted MPP superfamily phosphohydrolase